MGRKPKPTDLKRLEGNPGRRKPFPDEPQPEVQIPDAPDHLDELALAEWSRVTAELEGLGLVAAIYRGPLAAYAVAYSRWVKAEKQVTATGGPVLTSAEGGLYQNPHLSVANRALAQMQSLASEFGMTPSSKTRCRSATVGGSQSALKLFATKRA